MIWMTTKSQCFNLAPDALKETDFFISPRRFVISLNRFRCVRSRSHNVDPVSQSELPPDSQEECWISPFGLQLPAKYFSRNPLRMILGVFMSMWFSAHSQRGSSPLLFGTSEKSCWFAALICSTMRNKRLGGEAKPSHRVIESGLSQGVAST